MGRRSPITGLVGGLLAVAACSSGSGGSEATATVPESSTSPAAATGECAPLTPPDIEGGTTLAQGTCYSAEGSLFLDDGALEIEPGVTIVFGDGAGFTISGSGSLSAQGTEDAPITFASVEDSGTWMGIQLDGSVGSSLQHVVISNGGSEGWTGDPRSAAALSLTGNTEVDVQDSTITGSGGQAIVVADGVDLTFEGNTLEGNVGAAWVDADVAGSIGGTNVFDGNDDDAVRVGFTNGTLTTAQTWSAGVPYEVQMPLDVEAPLTLEPGARVAFGADVRVNVTGDGTLTAEGTAEEPITLTSTEDLPGFWHGLQIATAAAANVFDHVVFENGGSGQWTGDTDSAAMVRLEGNSKAVFTNSTFRGSGHYAVSVPEGGDISGFDANTISESARAMDVHPDRAGAITVTNSFTGNDEDRVRVARDNAGVVRTAQTWQSLDVPFYVTDRVWVEAALTIAAGTVVEFAQDASLEVRDGAGGALRAAGTADDPVTFRGGEDLAGYWKGIAIGTASADNVLEHTVLRNGGSQDWYGGGDAAASFYVSAGSAALSDVTFETGAGLAIIVSAEASVSCVNVDLGGLRYRTRLISDDDHASCPSS